jgi:hypothetical protein
VAAVIDETPGVRRFQVIQTGPGDLSLRLEARPGYHDTSVWNAVGRAMRDYLARQGLPSIRVERDPEQPHRDPTTGKFRQVQVRSTAFAPVRDAEDSGIGTNGARAARKKKTPGGFASRG